MEIENSPAAVWSRWHWWGSVLYIVVVTPIWVAIASQLDPSTSRIASATGCLLIGGVLVSAYTDLKWRLIPNWVTYPMILVGLGLNAFDSLTHYQWNSMLGTVGILDSVIGMLALFVGLLMVISFSGGGAGDVKLVGAMGAMLGFQRGGEAVFLSFMVSAFWILAWTVIQLGPGRILNTVLSKLGIPIVLGGNSAPKSDLQQLMKQQMPLGLSFAIGTWLVLLRDVIQEDAQPFSYLIFN